VIIAPGEKVFGALLAIAGAVIICSGHWATTDDMIADLIAGSADAGIWRYGLTDVEFSALTATFWSVEAGDCATAYSLMLPLADKRDASAAAGDRSTSAFG
jgi:hypothetical protein